MCKVFSLHLAGSRTALFSRTVDSMKVICICMAEHSSHKPHVATEHLDCVWMMEEVRTLF